MTPDPYPVSLWVGLPQHELGSSKRKRWFYIHLLTIKYFCR